MRSAASTPGIVSPVTVPANPDGTSNSEFSKDVVPRRGQGANSSAPGILTGPGRVIVLALRVVKSVFGKLIGRLC